MSLPRTPFGSVCHLVNGKAFKPTDWSGAGVPIIRIQNLNGPDKPFNHWAGALGKQVLVKTGDLLLAWSGTPGTSFGAHIWSGPNGILNQHIFRCDLDQKAITKEWARIAVNHRLYRLIEQAHGGVGLQHVTRGMVEELEIPLPPLAEQRRIAEVLDQAEALRAKRRAALAQLDSLTQSLFLDLFGDPATNPKGLAKETLEQLTQNITDGKHGDCRPSPGSGYFFVSVKDIKDGQIDYSDARQIDREDFIEVHRRTRLEAGDVLITNSGTIGKTAVVATSPELDRTTFQKSVAIVKPRRERLESLYLKAALDMCVAKLSRQSSGSSQKNLLLGQLRNFYVCVPPIELQREFVHQVAAVEKLKTAQRASLAELDALFASLQHRAFRGAL